MAASTMPVGPGPAGCRDQLPAWAWGGRRGGMPRLRASLALAQWASSRARADWAAAMVIRPVRTITVRRRFMVGLPGENRLRRRNGPALYDAGRLGRARGWAIVGRAGLASPAPGRGKSGKMHRPRAAAERADPREAGGGAC